MPGLAQVVGEVLPDGGDERFEREVLDDLVAEVSCEQAVLLNEGELDDSGDPLPRIGALDCGIKYNILRELSKRFEVLWAPPDIEWDELTDDWKIDALFCSNGPGDAARLPFEALRPSPFW